MLGLSVKLVPADSRPRPSRRATALVRLVGTGLTVLGLSQILPIPAAFGQTYSYYGQVSATVQVVQPYLSLVLTTTSSPLAFDQFDNSKTANPAVNTGIFFPNGMAATSGTVTVANQGNVSGT